MDTITSPVSHDVNPSFDVGLPIAVAKFAKARPLRKRLNGKEIVLNKRDYKIIFEMASQGFSRSSIAQVLRVSDATFLKLCARDQDCLDALDRGYAGDLQLMANTMRSHALDGNIHHMKAYMHVTHGIIIGEDTNRSNGLQINVQMPFPVASVDRVIEGD